MNPLRSSTVIFSLAALCASLQAQETFAKYHFADESLESTDDNSAVTASAMSHNRDIFFWEGNGYTNLCIGQAFSAGGHIEFTVSAANGSDTLSVQGLLMQYGGHGGNGDVDRMQVYTDAGGDNFQTQLYDTGNLGQTHMIDLTGVGILQDVAGPITMRIEFFDTNGTGTANAEWDKIQLFGTRNDVPPPPSNPCLGSQVYFDDGWQNSSYTVNGQTPEWFFPPWTDEYDVACIGNSNPAHDTHIPSIWSNSCSVGCRRLEFTIKGRNNGDDDSIGFVLGFCDGEQNDPNADYLAVIWNGPEQTIQLPNFCQEATRPAGLHLVRVTGIPDPAEFFGQTNLDCTPASSGVELLQEAINLTDTGWPPGVAQDIAVELTEGRLQVWVEGSLEIDYEAPIMVSYLEQCFGYYAQTQFADFWGLTVESLNNFPAAWSNYGEGTEGCAGVPEIGMLANPILGTLGQVFVGNATPDSTECALFVSLTPGELFLDILGGDLLVGVPLAGVVPLTVPPGGATFDCAVPDNSCVSGVSLYWQAICIDPCSPTMLAASRGMQMTFGEF